MKTKSMCLDWRSYMKIVTDTAGLFSPAQGRALDLRVVPACVIIDDRVYRDYEDLQPEVYLQMLKEGAVVSTSQPAIGDLIDVFEEDEEETLGIFIGDGLSGGYQNAMGAKNSIDENERIRVIDSKTLAGAEHYLVEKAMCLRNAGMNLKDLEAELLKTVETSVSFVIPADFEFLKRSGRLTPLAAKLGAMIKIVPVLTQTKDWKKITPFTIKRSWKKATDAILNQLESLGVDEGYRIYICHSGDLKNANLVLCQAKQRFPKVEMILMSLSPTMITHGGPGCVLLQAIKK